MSRNIDEDVQEPTQERHPERAADDPDDSRDDDEDNHTVREVVELHPALPEALDPRRPGRPRALPRREFACEDSVGQDRTEDDCIGVEAEQEGPPHTDTPLNSPSVSSACIRMSIGHRAGEELMRFAENGHWRLENGSREANQLIY